MKLTIDDEALTKKKVKKAKKQKKDDIPESNTESIIKTEKLLVKMSDNNDIKKKKRKMTTCPENVTDDADIEVCKKKRIVENVHTDSAEDLVKAESPKDKKKQKKIKNKTMQSKSKIEDGKAEPNVEKPSKNVNKVKEIVTDKKETGKKDKKKKTNQFAEEDISLIETVKENKSKKKKSKVAENGINIELSEMEFGKGKKKKRKAKTNLEENKEIKHEINDYKVCSSVGNEELEMESKQGKKKKHKKSKPENEMDSAVDKDKKTKQESFSVTTPKKKTKNSKGDDTPLLAECEVEAARKSKKHSKKVESKVDIDAGMKKKIKKEQVDHKESSHMEVVFLSEKAGNTDEVNVNKERRKALQMEIDQASQPKKPAKPLGLGQWSTAEFGSSEKQQKFLRLMGGFKKGFQPASASVEGGNMALGMNAQQQLQQGLLGEFERAHSRRMDFSNKGTGLGFIAQPTKKFSIDANATHSIRFDD
ncbi:uncharacterized protein knop1 [Eucyclogobius newberryi]|uniref:uncharacterized protein knop1 n=1 Tax=Eucyclogobius newberryi TaxID=166745 RepID=UPI003B5A9479